MRKIVLSAKTIAIKDLEDPKIEAFVYNNSFFIKSQVTLPQCATTVCKDHSLKEIRSLLWHLSHPPPPTPPLKYLFPIRLGTKKGELD